MTAVSRLLTSHEAQISGWLLVLMPALAAMFWGLERDAAAPLAADSLLAVMLALPLSAGYLAPVALPSLSLDEAVAAGSYALAAIVGCGSVAMWFAVELYVVVPDLGVRLTACLVALLVYTGLSGWALARPGRFVRCWPLATAAGIVAWLAVLVFERAIEVA